jgi:integrase
MARSYRGVRPQRHFVYSVDDVISLFGISRNTLTNWKKSGLRCVDDAHPLLITGAELARFHRERKEQGRQPLKVGQFICRRCAIRVYPDAGTLSAAEIGRMCSLVRAQCPDCEGTVIKLFSGTILEAVFACQKANAPLRSLDEEDSPIPGDVGKHAGATRPTWTPGNERVLHLYLKFAGQFHARTVEAIMAAIRGFEAFHHGKPFDRLKSDDVSAWRDHLLKRGSPGSPEGLSRSTVRHHASHLRRFLGWLVKQDGHRRLNGSLSDYARLPKGQSAALLQPEPSAYPTPEEAAAMITAMPTGSLIERRDRAVVATAFLTGLRAATLASLRFGDIDVIDQSVRIDARHVRAKNGKSQQIFWFPVGPAFEGVVEAWLEELGHLGARAGDAAFPPNEALGSRSRLVRKSGQPIACWKSEDGIGRAFRAACEAAGLQRYTPHAARHCLAALGNRICRKEEDREAWSKNMGHSTRQVTVSHYAKLTPAEHKSAMAKMRRGDTETEDDKDLLLAYHEHRLVPGSPEFERAWRLDDERRMRHRRHPAEMAAREANSSPCHSAS